MPRTLKDSLLCLFLAAFAALAIAGALTALDARALIKAQFGVAQKIATQQDALIDRHAKQLEQDARLRLGLSWENSTWLQDLGRNGDQRPARAVEVVYDTDGTLRLAAR